MGINADVFRIRLEAIVNKEQGSGYLSQPNLNANANTAQLEKFTQDFRKFQNTQKVSDDLMPFFVFARLPLEDGFLTLPIDFRYFASLRGLDTTDVTPSCDIDYANLPQKRIKVLDSDKVADRLSSVNFKPTFARPLAEYRDGGIQVYPTTINSVILVYLRVPADYVWGFTVGANGLPVYEPSTSTDFEWGTQCMNELLVKTAKYFGVFVREEELYNAATQLDAQGV